MMHNIGALLMEKEGKSLTRGQLNCLNLLEHFADEKEPRGIFILKGAAGTGKTSLIRILVQFLKGRNLQTTLLAPTGRAAKVVSARAKMYASTLHRHIFQADEASGSMSFFLKPNRDPLNCWYIVDEASMVGNQSEGTREGLLNELLRFAWEGSEQRKIVMVGDPYQLPPVGSDVSPALDPKALQEYSGRPVREYELLEVMRQEEGSGILGLAEVLRDNLINGTLPEVEPDNYEDVSSLESLNYGMEELASEYEQGVNDKIALITYSNALATRANLSLRYQLYGAEEPLVAGEPIMVVKNNYAYAEKTFPFIANGELGTVTDVDYSSMEEKYGLKWVDASIAFQGLGDMPVQISCKIILDLLGSKSPNLEYRAMQRVMQERRQEFETESRTKMGERFRKDPYINGLQIKYGYAMTGHKAQGGQWKKAIVCFEGQMPGMSNQEYLRWGYTAITRAEEKLSLIGFPFRKREF